MLGLPLVQIGMELVQKKVNFLEVLFPLILRNILRWKTSRRPGDLGSTEVQLDKWALGEVHCHIGNTWWRDKCELKITVNDIKPMTVTIVRIKSLRIQTEATCERVKENLMLMLFIIRLWNFRQNQPGLALTNRGKLEEAKSRKRRRGDLILPIAAAAHEQLGICPVGIL